MKHCETATISLNGFAANTGDVAEGLTAAIALQKHFWSVTCAAGCANGSYFKMTLIFKFNTFAPVS
jgi:hypothetical protein